MHWRMLYSGKSSPALAAAAHPDSVRASLGWVRRPGRRVGALQELHEDSQADRPVWVDCRAGNGVTSIVLQNPGLSLRAGKNGEGADGLRACQAGERGRSVKAECDLSSSPHP
jgi:hypothetical protein